MSIQSKLITKVVYKSQSEPPKWSVRWRWRTKHDRFSFITFGFVIDIKHDYIPNQTADVVRGYINIELHIPLVGFLSIGNGLW
jgi:hypothetical protein